jgi:hypothetical protein
MKSRKYYAAPIKKPSTNEKKRIVEISIPSIKDVLCESRPIMWDGNRKLVVHNLYNTYVYGR